MKKLFALLLLSFPLMLKAQNSTSSSYWGLTFHVGPFASGLPSHLEETMKSQGYFPPSNWLSPSSSQPMARQNAVYQLAIEKVASKFWSGKLLLSNLQGHVSGFSSQSGELRMNYKITTSALLGGYYFR